MWANVYGTDCLARIDKTSGSVTGWVLLHDILDRRRSKTQFDSGRGRYSNLQFRYLPATCKESKVLVPKRLLLDEKHLMSSMALHGIRQLSDSLQKPQFRMPKT